MNFIQTQKYCGWCSRYKPEETGKQVMTMKLVYAKFKCGNCLQAHKSIKKVI